MSQILAFNRWSTEGIKIDDPGLVNYINLNPRIVPRSGGKNVKVRFHKNKSFIVERLMNKLMMPGHKARKHKLTSYHCTGKGHTVYNIMEEVLRIVEQKTGKNPIMVLAKAIENAAPREEIITIEYGGAKYPKAVECAPQRRVDYSLRLMVQGSYQKKFNSKKGMAATLADEIIAAYNCSPNSTAIQKKLEIERQADSAR
jgi:small subunit ribosomal protein S7